MRLVAVVVMSGCAAGCRAQDAAALAEAGISLVTIDPTLPECSEWDWSGLPAHLGDDCPVQEGVCLAPSPADH